MRTLWFVVPVHGRMALTAICLRQLRRTCDALADHRIEATAVVIADTPNLDDLREHVGADLLGFGHVVRDNQFLSRRFNDGIQLALDDRFNPRPADYVIPCGSDDWLDYRILLRLPPPDTILAFQDMAFVREDGREISYSRVAYMGGCGIRAYPRRLMAPLGYRPADEDRTRGCDTSILTNLRRHHRESLRVRHRSIYPWQIVDWKSDTQQINSYAGVGKWNLGRRPDPFDVLAGVYPDESLQEMSAHYHGARDRVLASA